MPHFTEPLNEATDVRRLGNVGGEEHESGDEEQEAGGEEQEQAQGTVEEEGYSRH